MVVTSHPASGSLYFSSNITSSHSFSNTLSRPDNSESGRDYCFSVSNAPVGADIHPCFAPQSIM